jgi:hypothetical protein
MVEKKYLFIGVVALAAVIVAIIFFPTETGRVKKQFRSLTKWIAKESDESKVTMALKIKNIMTVFAQTCKFKVAVEADFSSGTYSAKEIAQNAAIARSHFSEIALKFYDLEVDFPKEGTATAFTTAKFTGFTTEGDAIEETHELECTLQKIEDAWLFTEVEVVEVLKK